MRVVQRPSSKFISRFQQLYNIRATNAHFKLCDKTGVHTGYVVKTVSKTSNRSSYLNMLLFTLSVNTTLCHFVVLTNRPE